MHKYLFIFLMAFHVHAQNLGLRPIILVHGLGPSALVNMSRYKDFLMDDGISANRILLVDYPTAAGVENITEKIKPQLESFIARFPNETKFDVIGHSLGGFVGLYAPLVLGYGDRIHKYVSLAGITKGISQAAFPCFTLPNSCGKAMQTIHPAYNLFIMRFLSKYEAVISEIEKCALYSYQDGLVLDPVDSGAFKDGRNFEIPNTGHMSFIEDRSKYETMKKLCYE